MLRSNMNIRIHNFKVKLLDNKVGTFSTTIDCDDFAITIHNISLYIWRDGSRQIFFPSDFKKEPLINSEDLEKFIKEELTNNFLKSYLYFKNSVYRVETHNNISINLEPLLKGVHIDLFEYEAEINELISKYKSECSILNEEISVHYTQSENDEDHKFEILNTIFKFIEEKYPDLRDDIRQRTVTDKDIDEFLKR